MKILMNISMFFIPAIFSFIVYIGSTYRRGGAEERADFSAIFLLDKCLYIFGFLCKRDRNVSF